MCLKQGKRGRSFEKDALSSVVERRERARERERECEGEREREDWESKVTRLPRQRPQQLSPPLRPRPQLPLPRPSSSPSPPLRSRSPPSGPCRPRSAGGRRWLLWNLLRDRRRSFPVRRAKARSQRRRPRASARGWPPPRPARRRGRAWRPRARRPRGLRAGRAGPGSRRRGSRRAVFRGVFFFLLRGEYTGSRPFSLSLSLTQKRKLLLLLLLLLTLAWKG